MRNPLRGLRFARLEANNIKATRIMKVVVVAISIIPLLYGALYLAAFIDPYQTLNDVPVAIVNDDSGASLGDQQITAGSDLCDELAKRTDGMQWNFVSDEDAQAGIEDGTYYMALYIPSNFSETLASADTDDPEQAQLTLQANQAKNLIASQIGTTVFTKVQAALVQSISEQYYDSIFVQINDAADSIQTAADGAADLNGGLVTASEGSGTITSNLSTAADGSGTLTVGLSALDDGLQTLKSSSATLADGVSQLDDGGASLASGVSTAATSSAQLASGASQVSDGASQVSTGASDLSTNLNSLDDATGASGQLYVGATSLSTGLSALDDKMPTLTAGVTAIDTGANQLAYGEGGTASSPTGDSLAALASGSATLASRAQELAEGASELSTAASQAATSASTIAAGTKTTDSYVDTAVSSLSTTDEQTYTMTADGVQALEAAQAYLDGTGTQAGLVAGTDALSSGLTSLSESASTLSAGADQVATGAGTVSAGAEEAYDGAVTLATGTDGLSSQLPTLSTGVQALATGASSLTDGIAELGGYTTQLSSGASTLAAGASSTASGALQVSDGASQLSSGLDTASSGAASLSVGLSTLSSSIPTLTSGVSELADGSSSAVSGSATLTDGLDQLSDGSATLTDGLSTAVDGSSDLATGLSDGVSDISMSQSTEDAKSSMMSDPVSINTDNYTSVKNYGTGFAPYFIALGLWVGALLMTFVTKPLDGRVIRSGAPAFNATLAGWLPMFFIASVQSVLLMLVLQFGLKLQIDHVLGAYLFVILISAVFTAIMQLLSAAFGFPGKALAIILLMLQLTSSAGTFPIETTPQFFQVISPYLPMTYCVTGMRQLMTGLDMTLAVHCALVLLGFGVACFLLTVLTAHRKQTLRMTDLHPVLDL